MPQQIFAAQHNPTTTIRVIYGRDVGDGSKGLDVLLSGRDVFRAYTPEGINAWFQANSKKNLEPWRTAFHQAHLGPSAFSRPTPKDIVLDVPYYSQRDNERHPLGTCNVTSYAMDFDFYDVPRREVKGKQWKQREDELSAFLEANGKDRHLHGDLVWMAKQYGLAASFATDRTLDEIRAEVRNGHPVIVSGLFTKAGHIVPIIGVEGDDFICNDPFGNALTKYRDRNGAKVLYPAAYMLKTMRSPGRDAKWAHFIRRRAA